jgi:CBS domain-containing protein
MARTVDEIMNREVLMVGPEATTREVLNLLRSFALGALPVVDDARRPLGMLSLRDVFETDSVAHRQMSKPAMCVSISATIDDAARQLARTDRHHLIVVDGAGCVVGMLSTLDLLRALLGIPVRHPVTFPHSDETTQVAWTDDLELDPQGCANAPDCPGFLVIVSGAPGERDVVVWSEPCASVRARALELALSPSTQEPVLARHLARSGLRFRAAAVLDESARYRIAALLRDRLRACPAAGGNLGARSMPQASATRRLVVVELAGPAQATAKGALVSPSPAEAEQIRLSKAAGPTTTARAHDDWCAARAHRMRRPLSPCRAVSIRKRPARRALRARRASCVARLQEESPGRKFASMAIATQTKWADDVVSRHRPKKTIVAIMTDTPDTQIASPRLPSRPVLRRQRWKQQQLDLF